jgi:hypothetical protein
MAKKYLIFGMAVLLGASLSFLGCEQDTDDPPAKSDNAAITESEVRIKGAPVVWSGTAANDGTAFDKAKDGTVSVLLGSATPSDFKLPANATMEAYIEASEVTAEAGLTATPATSAADFDTALGSTAATKHVYLKVTAEAGNSLWYKLTVTIADAKAWFSDAATFRLVTISGTNALLSVGTPASEPTDWAEAWYALSGDTDQLAILKAVYEPNAPDTTDALSLDNAANTGGTKTAVAYTATLSAEVLALFQFTTTDAEEGTENKVKNEGETAGDTAGGDIEKIDITGTALPDAATYGASATNLIVIDIGKTGTDAATKTANAALPKFVIPTNGLGSASGNYAHIRLRVNSGAYLLIDADNSAYIASGAGHPTNSGYFNGGCVEVMAGGKLRDGAYEGFPLGSNAVIVSRYGSYLSTGAETYDGTGVDQDDWNAYFAGYLLGPVTSTEADKPKVEWEATDSVDEGSYFEVRKGAIATNAKLTVKKTFGIFYSVWFVGEAILKLDVPEAGGLGGIRGLVSLEQNDTGDYNFYANTSGTVITINTGNILDKRFLTSGNSNNTTQFITASDSAVSLPGATTGSLVYYVNESTGISGYLVPPPAEEAE